MWRSHMWIPNRPSRGDLDPDFRLRKSEKNLTEISLCEISMIFKTIENRPQISRSEIWASLW